ncbi:dipeptide/tripeptide permease [Elysia marginata]|uniref:Dipeptide/tripeptide permease n=1 Tax=Elysia marginata TaxID=1093978 RepID=A0AAV4GNP4_9GAST|nr:dipeptide/tripeptide permease [Elysia marginata]
MVGGLYKKDDASRDKAFYIFYMGINIGALLAPILCGWLGEKYNWHYGFGLAAIGMFLGQIVYLFGQKYLKGVGEFTGQKTHADYQSTKKPLTSVEKDRIKVLILAFVLIIIFFGAFEQAGGLMNLYAKQKTDRFIVGWEVPAAWFQALNSLFIILLSLAIAIFWEKRMRKGEEASSIFKIAIGTLIMGWGFSFMTFASLEYEATGSSAAYWLVLAYLFHTIGELCASPVALSFITKLTPVKYASSMMGYFFAATGVGNILAGYVGGFAKDSGETEIFTGIVIFCTIITILILFILKPLKRLTHGAERVSPN